MLDGDAHYPKCFNHSGLPKIEIPHKDCTDVGSIMVGPCKRTRQGVVDVPSTSPSCAEPSREDALNLLDMLLEPDCHWAIPFV